MYLRASERKRKKKKMKITLLGMLHLLQTALVYWSNWPMTGDWPLYDLPFRSLLLCPTSTERAREKAKENYNNKGQTKSHWYNAIIWKEEASTWWARGCESERCNLRSPVMRMERSKKRERKKEVSLISFPALLSFSLLFHQHPAYTHGQSERAEQWNES